MAESVCVAFSGPALAFLLYENVKTLHEQEGFLLGESNLIVKKKITDAVGDNVEREQRITVKAVIPCPQTCLFYDSFGRINVTKLKAILGEQQNSVVAWFKYRRNSDFKLSVREKIIHKGLMQHFPIKDDLFSVCLLSSCTSNKQSTHSFSHRLLRYYRKWFQTIPIRIDNLGEPYNTYKAPTNSSGTFLRLYESLDVDPNEANDLNIITDIQKKLQQETSKIVTTKLEKSEPRLAQLQREVELLRKQLEAESMRKKVVEPVILDNGIVVDDSSGPYFFTIQKERSQLSDEIKSEENKEIISLDSNSDTSLSPSTNTGNEAPLIDLTLTDEEDLTESQNSSRKVLTYAQVMAGQKCKRNA